MTASPSAIVYGLPDPGLVDIPEGAVQTSPLIPGSTPTAEVQLGSPARAVMLAPPGTAERRYEIASLLRVLAPNATAVILAPKDMGGSRLAKELAGFGCDVDESAKRHHRICAFTAPAQPTGLDEAIMGGAPRRLSDLGLWSQPGIFSWDRLDPGTAALMEELPDLAGTGADFGCGIGILAHRVLVSPKVTRLHLVDIDHRAVEAARRNVDDPRADFAWADVSAGTACRNLDFVVMNPPFHAAGHEDKGLGQIFIRRAAEALRAGGRLWLVANRHLPYEAVLKPLFRHVAPRGERRGFKVIEAQK